MIQVSVKKQQRLYTILQVLKYFLVGHAMGGELKKKGKALSDIFPTEEPMVTEKDVTLQDIKGQVILYKNHLEVRLEKDTVWLTQKQMSDLFDKDTDTIGLHLRNIYKENELKESATTEESSVVQIEGNRQVHRKVRLYNLDAIISVGYRVNSKRGTQFRIWATNVLRRHLVDGYTINEKRLKTQQNKIQELQNTVRLLGNIVQLEGVSDEAKGIVQIISEYSKALSILDDFDHQSLTVPKGTGKTKYKLTYEEARKIIDCQWAG
jgi:hypothetical protein